MKRNLVVFGPAHAGKSTLVGYMLTKLTKGFDLEQFTEVTIRKFQELGAQYDPSLKFAYIVDTTKDERTRIPKSKRGKLGTSRYMHIDRIELAGQKVVIIDTPGAQHIERERIRGMYYGEIGVFMIEMSKLLDGKLIQLGKSGTLQDFVAPLCVWRKLMDDKQRKLIVLISKMDESEFSAEQFSAAMSIVRRLYKDEEETIRIIPVSIDVDAEVDHNVFSRSENMPWYEGPTLIDELDMIFKEEPIFLADRPFFGCIQRHFDIKGIGTVIQAKILQGSVEQGAQVKITPVRYKNRQFATAVGTILNIREVKGDDIKSADTGSLVGINLHDLRVKGRRCSKDDIDAIETSCLVTPARPVLLGNVIQVKTSIEEASQMNLLEIVMIPWLGRFVSTTVVHKKELGDHTLISLEIDNMIASLPLDDSDRPLFRNVLIKAGMKGVFIPAVLETLGIPDKFTLPVKELENRKQYIDRYYSGYEYELEQGRIAFHSPSTLTSVIGEFVKFTEKYGLGSEELEESLMNASLAIREWKEI